MACAAPRSIAKTCAVGAGHQHVARRVEGQVDHRTLGIP